MSNFTKEVWEDKWYCIDDHFWNHRYWYVKMTQEEKESDSAWLSFNIEWREVLNGEKFSEIILKNSIKSL